MHRLTALTLTLSTLAAIAVALPTPPSSSSPTPALISFTGTGQLRTRWNDGDYADLGCLTETGLWTADNTLCGTFTATTLDSSTLRTFTLTSAAGPCKILGARFTCQEGNEAYAFGIWPFPNSIPGVDCLRWGQYGLMASSAKNPPGLEDAPEEIHGATYSEVGKYVWLTWRSLEL
ncbi:uncharacterized protein B0T15DRAFT_107736 [Chaetomium strumarium]|uniref:RNase T2-like C-terminal domain-containing protein n=1 Tax=Chaetomium strumarium TaxID=1170767 RepID=A0AAJ0GYC5_9PEZI|nr:hypothetical protein B0T15DRAFT_107736 [Chaetomium strumarium]